jgi:hypothetical protein
MLGTRTILGLAIDEFGIVAAEVSARAGRPEIRRVGQVTFDEKLSSENVNNLAGQLKQFLRTNHLSSKHVVVGIPLKWVVAREVMAPAATADAIAGMLGIQAERAFSLNSSELLFDYYGSTSTTDPSRVMLLAARRQMIDQIKEMVVAAGLKPLAVTVSALAFNGAKSSGGFGLYARPTYCEFWGRSNGRLEMIRHVPIVSSNGSAGDPAELLTATIQKQIMLTPLRDQSGPVDVTLYDASGLSGAVIERLNKQLKPQIALSDGRSALLSGSDQAQAQAVAAAAVAMTAIGARPAVDFLNPRIGAKKASSHKKVLVWGVAAAALVVLGVGGLGYHWYSIQSDIDAFTAKLKEEQPQIDAAQQVVNRINYAAPWIDQEPRFLQCLKELSAVFPQTSNSVWATSLNFNDKGGGAMSGKATRKDLALRVINDIAKNPNFSEVNMNFIREAGKNGFEFSVNFQYKSTKAGKAGKGGK